MNYAQGLDKLKSFIKATAYEQEFLRYDQLLRENIRNEQLFGSTEEYRNTRAQIIAQLNRLVHKIDGTKSFNDLCF